MWFQCFYALFLISCSCFMCSGNTFYNFDFSSDQVWSLHWLLFGCFMWEKQWHGQPLIVSSEGYSSLWALLTFQKNSSQLNEARFEVYFKAAVPLISRIQVWWYCSYTTPGLLQRCAIVFPINISSMSGVMLGYSGKYVGYIGSSRKRMTSSGVLYHDNL